MPNDVGMNRNDFAHMGWSHAIFRPRGAHQVDHASLPDGLCLPCLGNHYKVDLDPVFFGITISPNSFTEGTSQ